MGSESRSSEESSDEESTSGGGTDRGGTGGSGFGCDWGMVAGMNGERCGNAGLGELLETDSESEGMGSDSGGPGSVSDVARSESGWGSWSGTGPVTGSGERFCSRLE